jgi:hypothetical protein
MAAAMAPTIASSEKEIHRIRDGAGKAEIPNHVAAA